MNVALISTFAAAGAVHARRYTRGRARMQCQPPRGPGDSQRLDRVRRPVAPHPGLRWSGLRPIDRPVVARMPLCDARSSQRPLFMSTIRARCRARTHERQHSHRVAKYGAVVRFIQQAPNHHAGMIAVALDQLPHVGVEQVRHLRRRPRSATRRRIPRRPAGRSRRKGPTARATRPPK